MTTDYDLFNMFDLLKAVKRNANFGTTSNQRSRANQNETARFEAANPSSVGTRAGKSPTGLGETGQVAQPAKTQVVAQPRKPKAPAKPAKPADSTATTIDGKVKPKPKPKPKAPVKTKKEKKVPAKSLSRKERFISQLGADPTSSRARTAYSGSIQGSARRTSLADKRRREAARKLSAGASDAATYQARKLQNKLGVRGVGVPAKVVAKPEAPKKKKKISSPVGKTSCPLIKTELNGAFNNLLDNFQQLYK
jgi:hypothetical protein